MAAIDQGQWSLVIGRGSALENVLTCTQKASGWQLTKQFRKKFFVLYLQLLCKFFIVFKIFFKLFIKIPLNWVLVKHYLFFIGR